MRQIPQGGATHHYQLRVPEDMFRELQKMAKDEGLSVNQLILAILWAGMKPAK